jgi:DNA polymerase-3 subunit alpha
VDGKVVRVCGIISSLVVRLNKRDEQWARVTIEDFTGRTDAVVFTKVYKNVTSLLKENNLVMLVGKAETAGDAIKMVAEEVYSLDDALQRYTKSIVITMSARDTTEERVRQGVDVIEHYGQSGNCSCFFYVTDGEDVWRLHARNHYIKPTRGLLDRLITVFGRSNVQIAVD